MKVIFEFDTESEHFDSCELERHYQANHMAYCLSRISDKLRSWSKWEERETLPIEEVCDSIFDIITEEVDLERLGY